MYIPSALPQTTRETSSSGSEETSSSANRYRALLFVSDASTRLALFRYALQFRSRHGVFPPKVHVHGA